MKCFLLKAIAVFGVLTLCAYPIAAQVQWVQIDGPGGGNIYVLAASGSNLFAGTANGGVSLSTDSSVTWTALNSGLTNTNVRSLTVSNDTLYAGTNGGGIFRSINNAKSWTAVDSGLTNDTVYTIAMNGSTVLAGTHSGGVFRSTNNGTSWTAVNAGLTNTEVWSLVSYPLASDFFAGTENGAFGSTFSGTSFTWNYTGLMNTATFALALVNGSKIFAGTGEGIFLSTNNGSSWDTANSGLTSTYVLSFAVSGNNIFAGTNSSVTNGGGIFLSNNNGASWTSIGLTNTTVQSIAVSSTNIFAVTESGVEVYRAPLLPSVPVLSSPTNGAAVLAPSLSFSWGTVSSITGASSYSIRVATVSSFGTTVASQGTLTTNLDVLTGLSRGLTYYWQVNATNSLGTSAWSSTWSLSGTSVRPQKDAGSSGEVFFSNSAIIYELPASSNVSIVLYDIQGRQVSKFVNAMQNAGSYAINLSRTKVRLGYYILEFKAGLFVLQKKLALID